MDYYQKLFYYQKAGVRETGIANRYQTEGTPCPTLRMIVIYTGDIERKKVSCQYDIGAVHMEIASLVSGYTVEEIQEWKEVIV